MSYYANVKLTRNTSSCWSKIWLNLYLFNKCLVQDMFHHVRDLWLELRKKRRPSWCAPLQGRAAMCSASVLTKAMWICDPDLWLEDNPLLCEITMQQVHATSPKFVIVQILKTRQQNWLSCYVFSYVFSYLMFFFMALMAVLASLHILWLFTLHIWRSSHGKLSAPRGIRSLCCVGIFQAALHSALW